MDCRNHVLRPLLAGLFVLVLASSTDAATLNVPANYSTIQAAVNAATPGDTIRVSSGTYYEHVTVTKRLTLMGVNTGTGLPVVDAQGSGHAIILFADGCTLQGFVVTQSLNGWVGIYIRATTPSQAIPPQSTTSVSSSIKTATTTPFQATPPPATFMASF